MFLQIQSEKKSDKQAAEYVISCDQIRVANKVSALQIVITKSSFLLYFCAPFCCDLCNAFFTI